MKQLYYASFRFKIQIDVDMKRLDVERFINRPCRFKLKSGKEVFGVIWNMLKEDQEHVEYYFASNGDFMKFRQKRDHLSQKSTPPVGCVVNLEDIIYAEYINI